MGVVLVIVLDDWPDTIPPDGGQMLPQRGGNMDGAAIVALDRARRVLRRRLGHISARPPRVRASCGDNLKELELVRP